MSEEDYSYLFKIVIIGDSGVGKSNIFTRFIKDEFIIDSKATIGVEFSAKNVTIKEKVIKAQVWDTAGQERFKALAKNYYRGAVGALLVYDITNYESFKNTEKWLKEVKEHAEPNLVTLLIGNKSDLDEKRAVKTEEGAEFAQKIGSGFIETSAKNNVNIESAFHRLVSEVFDILDKVGEETSTARPSGNIYTNSAETITIGNKKKKSQDGGCAC